MQNGKKIVGITQGDANGVGYEVIIKSLADHRILGLFTPVIYGSSKMWSYYKRTLHDIEQNFNVNVVSSAKAVADGCINIVNCVPDNFSVEPGQMSSEAARTAILSLKKAVEELKASYIDVLVTAPINKKSVSLEGFTFVGHTEYLQKQFGDNDNTGGLMLMNSDRLKVAVVTGHMPLNQVCATISSDLILSKLRLLNLSLKRDFAIEKPNIAVLGLNPHCGDYGLLGDEEKEVILPAINEAKMLGINAFGPYSSDGFFALGHYCNYDAVLAMYHDQGLAPFKAIAFEEGVNFTAGLPIIRTSPVHGTAYEIAGQDKANPKSMMSAIFTAIDIHDKRMEYDNLFASKMKERKLSSVSISESGEMMFVDGGNREKSH